MDLFKTEQSAKGQCILSPDNRGFECQTAQLARRSSPGGPGEGPSQEA